MECAGGNLAGKPPDHSHYTPLWEEPRLICSYCSPDLRAQIEERNPDRERTRLLSAEGPTFRLAAGPRGVLGPPQRVPGKLPRSRLRRPCLAPGRRGVGLGSRSPARFQSRAPARRRRRSGPFYLAREAPPGGSDLGGSGLRGARPELQWTEAPGKPRRTTSARRSDACTSELPRAGGLGRAGPPRRGRWRTEWTAVTGGAGGRCGPQGAGLLSFRRGASWCPSSF